MLSCIQSRNPGGCPIWCSWDVVVCGYGESPALKKSWLRTESTDLSSLFALFWWKTSKSVKLRNPFVLGWPFIYIYTMGHLTHGVPSLQHGVPTDLLGSLSGKRARPLNLFGPGTSLWFSWFNPEKCPPLQGNRTVFGICLAFGPFFTLFLTHFGVFLVPFISMPIHTLNPLFLSSRTDLQSGKTTKKGQKVPPLQGNRTVFGI